MRQLRGGDEDAPILRAAMPDNNRRFAFLVSVVPMVSIGAHPTVNRRETATVRRNCSRARPLRSIPMDDEALNMSIRKFLKTVGVNSQREIEHAVASAVASGKAVDFYPAQVTLKVPGLGLEVAFDGEIRLR
jgi:hypothetical protein